MRTEESYRLKSIHCLKEEKGNHAEEGLALQKRNTNGGCQVFFANCKQPSLTQILCKISGHFSHCEFFSSS